MTYRELLNLYKQGKLDDVRKKEVEAAIEKQDAISEFLYEEGEIPEFSDLESENAENPENKEWLAGQKNNQKDEINRQFIKEIRWSIRKAFIKMGMIVGVAVLVIVLCAVFILPKAVSDFYYNPNRSSFYLLRRSSRCLRMVWMKTSELTALASTPSMRLTRSLVAIPSFRVSKQAASNWSPKFCNA